MTAPKVRRPSRRALESLALLADGWQMGFDTMDGGFWLQAGLAGRGGATKSIHAATAWALIQNGWVEKARESWPTRAYQISELGRQHLLAAEAKA